MEGAEQDWKLRLKYGRLITPYKHFTIIADGEVDELAEGFECPKGKAYMGMKIWAESIDQSADVYQNVGEQIGFSITGQLQIYESEPEQAPGENPSAYDIIFTPFSE